MPEKTFQQKNRQQQQSNTRDSLSMNKENRTPLSQKRRNPGSDTIACYNCGEANHKKPDCKLPFDHPKCRAYRNKVQVESNTKKLKQLRALLVDHDANENLEDDQPSGTDNDLVLDETMEETMTEESE